jgi:hypothetical protein
MNTKSWYASKTLWFNGLTVLVVVATFLGWTPNQDLANQATGILVTIAPVLNIVLRLVTKQPITTTQA